MSGHPRDKAREWAERVIAEQAPNRYADARDVARELLASLAREEAERAGRKRAEAALRKLATDPAVIAALSAREPGKETET